MKFGVLQVTGPDGSRRNFPLDVPSVLVGRGSGCDIQLPGDSVSDTHARLVIDTGRLIVEDLSSEEGTFLNGTRLVPNSRNLVQDGAELRFGSFFAKYAPPVVTGDDVDGATRPLTTSSRIGLTLSVPGDPVYAGAPWTGSVLVHNRGTVVDRLELSVPDLPEGWVKFEKRELALAPGGTETVSFTITPPRTAESLAGLYDFSVACSSAEYSQVTTAQGRFVLQPFRNLQLSFVAARARGKFEVIAENAGNEPASYRLSGEDPDAAWDFNFESPIVRLEPGERQVVPLRVRKKRQLFGPPTALQFVVHAESTAFGESEKVTALGQLAITPPLQRFVAPAIFLSTLAVIIGTVAIVTFIRTDGQLTKANAESQYAGVHLCDKDEKAKADAKAKSDAAANTPATGGSALIGSDSSGAPYFAQNDPRWAKVEYAKAQDPDFGPDWCGSTIEQCGCAMTSVATTMALYGLLNMADGKPLTPESMNAWFNADAVKTQRGWVSRGFIYGDVIWTAANELSGEMAAKNPGAPTIRFAGTGTGADDEVREQLKMGRPVVLEVPGHWIAATGLDGDNILINDPYYRDRKTLDVYKGKVKSSVFFEPSADLSAVVFTAPADVRVKITDKKGRVVGTLATGSAEDAAKTAEVGIPGASYSTRKAWRDPSCIESAPPTDAGTNQIVLPGSADDYTVEVIDASGRPTSIAIHSYDKQGKSSLQTLDNPGSAVAQVSVDSKTGKAGVKVLAGGVLTEAQSAATTTAGGRGVGDQSVAGKTPTPAATATPEPLVETSITIGTQVGDTFVAIQSQAGFAVGDTIIFSPGKANEEENRIIGFGSFFLESPLKYAHSPGETIRKKPRAPGTSAADDRPLPTPPPASTLGAPENLALGCSTVYQATEATVICTLDITGPFTAIGWTVNGKAVDEASNQQLLLMSFTGNGNVAVGVSVCNRTICKSTSTSQRITFPASTVATGTPGGTSSVLAVPTPTPPVTGVVVNCNTQYEQGADPRAVVVCAALFSGESTSISWTAPGAVPSSGQGKTFTTEVRPNTVSKIRVQATVCYLATCQTSPAVDISIGSSTTRVFLRSASVALGSSTTFTAIVTGPVPPAGGTVLFKDAVLGVVSASDPPIGLTGIPLFTAGSLGFAQITVKTGETPLVGENTSHFIYGVYSGGSNLFGSTSTTGELALGTKVHDACDSQTAGDSPLIDDECDLSLPREVGSGTLITDVSVSPRLVADLVERNGVSDVVVRPGAELEVNASAARNEYCPGCLRQVYLGIGANSVAGTGVVGPSCVFNGGLSDVNPGTAVSAWRPRAPSVPGVFYIRASSTTENACVSAPIGVEDMSVARVVVAAQTRTSISFWTTGGTPVQKTSLNPGDSVVVRLAVTSASATGDAIPTGTVLLREDSTAIGEATLAGGVASINYTVPATGAHSLRALYSGSPSLPPYFQNSDGSYQDFWESSEATISTAAVTVAGIPANAKVGDAVTATVNVAVGGSASAAGGALTLLTADGTAIPTSPASPTVAADGTASFSFTVGDTGITAPGSYSLRVNFGGTSSTIGADSSSTAVTVAKATSTTTLTLNPTSGWIIGDDVVLTATVVGAAFASPDGGVVEFTINGTAVGTSVVGAAPLASGVASVTFHTGGVPVEVSGTYAVVASFGGTSNLGTSASASSSLVVAKAPASVSTPTFSANPTTVGAAGTITVTVTPAGGYTPGQVSGVVDFFNGTTLLPDRSNLLPGGGNIALTVSTAPAATATYTLALLDAGSYTVGVAYQGSGKFDTSVSATASLTVSKADTSVVTTILNVGSIAVGDTLQLRATVPSATGVLNPDTSPATVQFYSGTSLIGTAQTLSGGIANLNWVTGNLAGAPLSDAGTYPAVHAVYSGNGNLNPATSADVSVTLTKRSPTLTVTVTPSSQTVGTSVAFSATVSAGAISPDGGTVQFKVGSTNVGSPVTVAGGTASLASVPTGVAPLAAAGSYTVTADYTENTNVASGSGTGSLTLTKAASVATLGAITSVASGESTTFSVTVTTSSGLPVVGLAGDTPTVQFRSNGTNVGSAVAVQADGSATYAAATGAGTDFPDVTSYTISAVYSGTSQLQPATSNNQTLVVTPAASVVTMTIPSGTLTVGSAGDVTVTVAPGIGAGPGAITGTVTVTATYNGSTVTVGSGTLANPPGKGNTAEATISLNSLNAGDYTNVVASYGGSTKYTSGTSSPQSLTISKASTSVVATVLNAGAVAVGDTLQLRATVPSATGVLNPDTSPATVQFYSGTSLIGTAQTLSGGIANLNWVTGNLAGAPLSDAGTYPAVHAVYSGNGNLNPATSADVSVTLTKRSPTVTVTVTPSSQTVGTSVAFSATVSAGAISPDGGTVQFKVGSTNVGSPVTVAGGTASLASVPTGVAPLAAAGSYTVTADYTENTNVASGSGSGSLTLTKAASTASLATIASVKFGASGTFEATVSTTSGLPVEGLAGDTVTVQFYKDSTPIGSPVSVGATGIVTYTAPTGSGTDFPTITSYNIWAAYSGTSQLAASDTKPTKTFAIEKAAPSVTLAITPGTLTVGGAGTLTATVAPTAAGSTGTVTGSVIFSSTETAPLSATVTYSTSGSSLVATLNISGINAGTYTNVVASYGGDSVYAGAASSSQQLVISKATPTVTLTAPGTQAIGTNATFTVSMTDNNDILQPDGGLVRIFVNGNQLCYTPLAPNYAECPTIQNGGTATLSGVKTGGDSIRFPGVGGYTINAEFLGVANLNGSTSDLASFTLTKAIPTVTLTVTPSTTTIGSTVTFSATVTAGVDTPISPDGGTVTFYAGANAIQSAVTVVSGAAAIADYTTGSSPFDTGDYDYTDLKASYSGNANVDTRDSSLKTLRLNKAGSSTSVDSISAVNLGQSVTFTARVTTGSTFNVSDGGATVQFYAGATAVGSPATVTAGVASVTLPTGPSTSFTGSGAYSITAVYSGTSRLASSTSGAQSFVINTAPTQTVLTLPSGTTTVGDAKSVTATVSATGATAGAFSGTVQFYDGASALGSPVTVTASGDTGVASLDVSGLNAATYNLTGVYSGDSKYATSTSSGASLTIEKATPTVTLAPPGTFTIGQAVTFSATVSGPQTGVLSPVGGTVTFKAGTSTITTATVTWNGNAAVASASVTTGSAPLDTGDYTYSDIVASFAGNANLNSADSAAGTLRLNKASATVTVGNQTSVAFGSSITYTATVVASVAGASIGNGTATVTFSVGGTPLGTQTLSGGQASLTVSPGAAPLATADTYSMTATYNGSSQVASALGTDSFDVVKATPTVTVTNDGPVTVGSSVLVTAAISAGVPVDGGTVTFKVGTTILGTAVVGGTGAAECGSISAASGQAKCLLATGTGTSLPTANGGPYTVTAEFGTTVQVAAGSGTTSVSLSKTGATVTFTSGPGTVTLGDSVSFVVTVSGNCPGTHCPDNGTVSLYAGAVGSTLIQTVTVTGNTATFTAVATGNAPFANAGTYTVSARFNGTANVAASDATSSLTVSQAASTTNLSSSGGPATYTLTATVAPSTFGGQSGSIVFQEYIAGVWTTFATVAGSTVSGSWVATTSVTPPSGSHDYRAVYDGNTNFAGSTSGTVTIAV